MRSLEDNDHVLFVFICLHPSSHGQATQTRAGLSDEGSGARVAELERERRRVCAEVQGQTEAERKEVIPGTGESDTEHPASHHWKQKGNSITREQREVLHKEVEKRKALGVRSNRENL